jgi:hypothetical protein
MPEQRGYQPKMGVMVPSNTIMEPGLYAMARHAVPARHIEAGRPVGLDPRDR